MADISDLERQEIERYLEWGEKRLFRELDWYYGASLPGGQQASYRSRGKGRVWFKRLLPRFEQTICEEWGYNAKKADPELKDKENLVIAVGDALTPLIQRNPFPTKGQVPIYLVAALVVRMDLDDLCGEGPS